MAICSIQVLYNALTFCAKGVIGNRYGVYQLSPESVPLVKLGPSGGCIRFQRYALYMQRHSGLSAWVRVRLFVQQQCNVLAKDARMLFCLKPHMYDLSMAETCLSTLLQRVCSFRKTFEPEVCCLE